MQMTAKCYVASRTALTPGNGCRYRDGTGNKCFVGALIADEDYNVCFDQDSMTPEFAFGLRTNLSDGIATKFIGFLNALRDISTDDLKWLQFLQQVHDSHELFEYKDKLVEFAAKYSLQVPK